MSTEAEPQAAPAASRLPGWVAVVAAVGVVVLALVAFMAGRLTAPATGLQSPSAVDVGFSRDMLVHHQQAVLMSELVRDRGEDPELRSIAVDIVLTQQNQAGQMQGWLAMWGVPFASAEPPMRWMGGEHASHGSDEPMTGMATQEQLNALEQVSGVEAERKYLELMIPHHKGGVEMAEYAVEHASVPAVRELADSMVRSQTVELDTLQKFLDARTP